MGMLADLDRKIAEAKGWRLFRPGETTPKDHAEWAESKAEWKPETLAAWSTSDSKALELVDELRAQGFHFHLADITHPEPLWQVYFIMKDGKGSQAIERTRPEAICRAWLAAQEWILAQQGLRRTRPDELIDPSTFPYKV